MSFVYGLALAAAVLVAVPYLAHLLRRRRAEERPFPAAHLVPAAPPRARRRAALEDRALFAVRAASVLALVLLGASPLVRCSRLSLQRSGGASVAIAIVLDDSMSMGARDGGGPSRFARAKKGAEELLASTRDGDAVAIVLAGAPARVALAATTDLGAARAALDATTESHRATDLDGALVTARALLAQLPQVDRRVVVLSDLADGNPGAPPLGEGSVLPVWVPLPDLGKGLVRDCGIVRADRVAMRVKAHVQCGPGVTADGREVEIVAGGKRVVGRGPAPSSGAEGDVVVAVPEGETAELTARLTGDDLLAADDEAPVLFEAGPGSVAVVADAQGEIGATGGAPVVEQALSALKLDIAVRPIPQVPDSAEDLGPFVGVLLDDPPGFTPEQRRALGAFVDKGGVVLLALGPRAAAAPLGASLEPILTRAVTWQSTTPAGARVEAARLLGEGAATLADLAPQGRAVLAPEDAAAWEVLLPWLDEAPLVARRSLGRGETWLVTLPFAVDASDLTLRPGFLAILDGWVQEARQRAAPRRGDVGVPWLFAGARVVALEGPDGRPLPSGEAGQVVPARVGAYRLTVDGQPEIRVAAPLPREMDLRPRPAASSALGEGTGQLRAQVDVSWVVALVLLALMAVELGVRVFSPQPT